MNEQLIIPNVPANRLDYFRGLAATLGGVLHSVSPEPDGEYTLIIFVPKEN